MRRWLIAFCILVGLSPVGAARAQDAIKIVVPFAAGGPVDAAARLLAEGMQAPLGTNIVIDNRGGGGGVIAADLVARAPADGKTLLMGSQGAHVISAVLQPHIKHDPVRSFEPLAMMGAVPTLLIVNRDLPVKSLQELVALAKSRKLTYGSAGAGTTMNIAGELLNAGAKVQIAHIPYRGVAPAIPDLIAGRLDLIMADPPVLLPLVQAGTVRPLAVFGAHRLAALPDIPTTVELGYPDMIMENWYGLLAPAGTPVDVVATLERAALAAIDSPKVQEHMRKGELTGTLDRQQFRARIERDVAFWRPTLAALGISVQGDAPAAAPQR
jgi:tripartite-type tricarboxylate transporter receptor subunit TctC